jgi:general secretion pathway protein D
MKKPLIAVLLAFVMVGLAEGPWAWAQTPAPDSRPTPPANQAPLQAPPAPARPATGTPTPTPATGAAPTTPPTTPAPTFAPAPDTAAPGTETGRRRPGDMVRPALRRTSRTTRPAAARPVTAPPTPGQPAPAPAAQVPPPATAPGTPGTQPGSASGSPGAAPAGTASPSTPNVLMPAANSEGVMELPGEKEFNQCKKVPPGKRILKFSFKPETEITDLIGWISAISCTQFLIGGTPVAGKKVTVMSPQLITLEEAYRLFLGALESVNLTVEPMGKFLRIVDTSRARFSNLPFQKNGSTETYQSDKRYVTRLFRFDHLDPNEVMNLYNQVRGEQGIAVAFQGSLIITDQSVMLDRFGEIIRELDQPSVIKEKIWMVRVRNTSATEMSSRLAEIFAVQQMGTGGRRPGGPGGPVAPVQAPAPGARPGAQMVKRVDLASQLSITKLIPDERSNQLIVVANEQAYEWLLTIMKKLDVPIEGGGDGRFHIYYCEHANCDELAATLSAVTGVSVIGGVGARRTSRTSVPGAAPPPPIAPTPAQGMAGQQPSQLFEGDVRVTFDAATNSLVVNSSLKDFQSLRRVIEKLDGPRKQVYVEAMILEVLLDKSRDLGVAYHGGLPTSVGGKESVVLGGFDAGKTLSPATLAGDLVGLAGAVFGPALEASTSRLFGTQVDIPSFGAFVKLLQKNNDVNVLSTPHLLITNNQEGEISVGQRLPFPGGFLGGFGGGIPGQQGAGGLGGLLGGTSVSREDVSLRMKLIPSVNEYNMIRLDVDVEISDLASPNFNGLGPATTKRTAKTPVVCKDQQTVIIGGLMSDRQSDTVQKIPVLGDIPVLGFFFRNTSKQLVKSNIIIALTPYVITDMEDLRRVAEKKMRERREFIERFSAVEDKAHFDAAIDYRRKRGMLEEINRASREIDDEEAALRVIRERELQDESTPIEPAGQTRPRAGEPTPGAPIPAVAPTSSQSPLPPQSTNSKPAAAPPPAPTSAAPTKPAAPVPPTAPTAPLGKKAASSKVVLGFGDPVFKKVGKPSRFVRTGYTPVPRKK